MERKTNEDQKITIRMPKELINQINEIAILKDMKKSQIIIKAIKDYIYASGQNKTQKKCNFVNQLNDKEAQISVRMPQKLIDDLATFSIEKDANRSQVIRMALREYITREKETEKQREVVTKATKNEDVNSDVKETLKAVVADYISKSIEDASKNKNGANITYNITVNIIQGNLKMSEKSNSNQKTLDDFPR